MLTISKDKQRIVIIGGGFAGMNLISNLDSEIYNIILVDRNNYHAFPPLFYQVASAGLEPASVCFPFRQELRKRKNLQLWMGEFLRVDTDNKIVETSTGNISYDFLIIATGTTSNFFGNNQLEDKVYTLKSTTDAIAIRNQVLWALERASTCNDAEQRKHMLCFVVIGGGPTGVEVAGALGEMKKYILAREYPDIIKSEVRVVLVEGSDRLLRTMSNESSIKSLQYLRQLEVEVKLNLILSSYNGTELTFNNGNQLVCDTVIWTAGVTGEPAPGIPQESVNKAGRIITDEYNRIKDIDNVFAIGDVCYMETPAFPHGHPQLAQVAIQQARNLASNLNKRIDPKPFRYNDKGSMATIGRNRAVADIAKMHFYGRPAWMIWMGVHLISLMGMKNKIFTFINWMWYYFTYTTALRLLIRPPKRKNK
ncbi:NAD(P)/FAD-dependent oxidoreductase [Coprobacter tertius]|uniref:NADH:ubiquinone reductase (non-electrogenic) n=1 Tax=Coprobacter tertius TaxID=2944915 RepID=A0ABT1MH96_9BACT|nr:NAD(P)/FAD-dependent oxidoreductase [Coprobacter tertius]MCP9611424.1 NAD(P)/FAD-dependent oxidoreductase [Coprobacter tertius]